MEGGYDFLALTESLRAVVSVLSLDRAVAPDWPTSGRRVAVAQAARGRRRERRLGTAGSSADQLGAPGGAANLPAPAGSPAGAEPTPVPERPQGPVR